MARDNERNILGDNSSNNQFDSSLVGGNADGSLIERIEYLQTLVAAYTTGSAIIKGVVDTAAPSTTNVKCATLAGYGEDFFNNVFYMQVVRSGGAAPEPEIRLITDYVTATGTFTCSAFSQNVEAGDLIYVMHESIVSIGRNDNNNTFDSSNVVANADGSILERLEYLQGLSNTEIADILAAVDTEINTIMTETNKIAATIVKIDAEVVKTAAIQIDIGDPSARTNFKSLETIIGVPDAANSSLDDMIRTGFDSSAIGNDEDGSLMERLEGLKDRLVTIAAYIDTEVAAIVTATGLIKTETDKIAATIVKIDGEVVKTTAIQAKTDTISAVQDGIKTTTIADGTTIPNNSQAAAGLLATATGGAVMIEEIIWQRGATSFTTATNYEFSTDNTNGLSGAAAPVGVALSAKFAANNTGVLSLDGTTKQLPFVLESGKKLYIHGDDNTTGAGGTTDFYIKYKRLAAAASLT